LLLTQIPRSTSLRPDFSLSGIASATGDVLANFLRISIFISLVNLFFTFQWAFSAQDKLKSEVHSHSIKYQNIATLEKTSAEHLAPDKS
jgi:hypothetical protein